SGNLASRREPAVVVDLGRNEIPRFFEIRFTLRFERWLRPILFDRVFSQSRFIELADSDHPKGHDLLACFAVARAGAIKELVEFIEAPVNRPNTLLSQLRNPRPERHVQLMYVLAVVHNETAGDLHFACFHSSGAA